LSQDEYRYIYSFMADYVRATVGRGPQIVITGAEGESNPQQTVANHRNHNHLAHQHNNHNHRAQFQQLHTQDGLSTDDSLSAVSSQCGSFETALDDVMDTMLPSNPEVS
jgi:hypothetical protein